MGNRREYALQFSSQRIDRAAGVIYGVAVMTAGQYTDRTYKTEAGAELSLGADRKTLEEIMASAQTYENGLKVKADHRGGVFDTGAHLKNFRIDDGPNGPVLRADLHILKTEANREKLLEMAETIPDTFGLSVAFSGPYEIIAGKAYDRCTEIYSADLVADPAANPTGLFSSRVDGNNNPKTMNLEEIAKECSELAGKFKSLQDAVAGLMPKDEGEKALSKMETTVKELSKKLEAAEGQIKEFATKQAAADTANAKLVSETAAAVAKEFSKVVGTAPSQGASRPSENEGAKSSVDKFEASAKKHFESTKSKVKAVELAMRDEPEGYKEFRKSGRDLKFAA